MPRYSWEIHTADTLFSGTSGDVYLSLHGLNASMKEVLLPNPEQMAFDHRDQIDSGSLDVDEDLGELDTGTLRTDGNSDNTWDVDTVTITNESSGRKWVAHDVGKNGEDGRFAPLQFEPVDSTDSGDSTPSDDVGSSQEPTGFDQEAVQAEISSLKARLDALQILIGKQGVCTIEIFGRLNGKIVPLKDVLRGTQIIKGASIAATRNPDDGFGLGGCPGAWARFYPEINPAKYGLDPLKPIVASDGTKAWPLSAQYLTTILGANWRNDVYGE